MYISIIEIIVWNQNILLTVDEWGHYFCSDATRAHSKVLLQMYVKIQRCEILPKYYWNHSKYKQAITYV